MAALKEPVKKFIVQALACYDTPQDVAEKVKEEFGLTIPRQQVQAYDPEKAAGANLSKKWRVLFEATRKHFLEHAADIPIAQQAYRLRALADLVQLARSRKNADLAARLLEQAAKEVGGAFTSIRRLGNVPGEGALKLEHTTPLSDEELEKLARGGTT